MVEVARSATRRPQELPKNLDLAGQLWSLGLLSVSVLNQVCRAGALEPPRWWPKALVNTIYWGGGPLYGLKVLLSAPQDGPRPYNVAKPQ